MRQQVELYMPKEDILVEGDYVNELFVVVSGEVQVAHTCSLSLAASQDPDPECDPEPKVHADASPVAGCR